MANNNKMPKLYMVKNRSASKVVYKIPDQNVRREFAPGEEKKISFHELEQLTFQPGGRELIANFLQVTEEAVTKRLNIHTENEYYMSESQIVELIKTGTIEAFLDCLDFAPVGVIDLIKTFAIKIPMTDTRKIAALKDKTGFDVEKALANSADSDKDQEEEAPKAKNTISSTGRRTNTSYKVVSKTAE